jgi:hypothetical protein
LQLDDASTQEDQQVLDRFGKNPTKPWKTGKRIPGLGDAAWARIQTLSEVRRFNGLKFELDARELTETEQVVLEGAFAQDAASLEMSAEMLRDMDLKFVAIARRKLELGLRVAYFNWW